MKMAAETASSFTVDDIRKVRIDFVNRYTDKNGRFDWDASTIETENSAAKIIAEINRIRAGINQ